MAKKHLVIVESPAKAKTIQRYLGKDFTVKSSFGHIRDLPKKGLSIDVKHGFEPTYEISDDKQKIVSELKRATASARDVWLATDEDREGEAIAWHLCHALKLDPKKTKRIVFHEITKPAIEAAIEKPRTVDQDLVNAQQARRVLDRLVGYELSPVLWKKVRAGLSAGRVQSVAVRLVVEREREIKDFKPTISYKVTAAFTVNGKELPAELAEKLPDFKAARKFLEDNVTATYRVLDIAAKPGSRNPAPPFTTSSLQQEAARRLGFSVKQTMTLAQRLYEAGHITYMRTDSTNVAETALNAMQRHITDTYGDTYYQRRHYQTKAAGAQEAHEAIRPTDFSKAKAGEDTQQQRLYELIFKRAVASQMAPASFDRTEVTIGVSTRKEQFVAKGEVLTFDGFLKVYGGTKEDVILPPVTKGSALTRKAMQAAETFSRPPARYSEASLVKKLEELGIGRPSTYAPTISTIQSRGYVEKSDLEGEERQVRTLTLTNRTIKEQVSSEVVGADRGKLLPTYLAEMTTDFLVKYFPEIIDYDFTAKVEEDFDDIAEGKREWSAMIRDFYKGFHPLVKKSETASREETSQARTLGTDPKSGKPIIARFGRYGPMLQLGETDEDEKPQFAPLPPDTTIETVTLEQAKEMFKLPRRVGTTADGQEITANIGRFGPYIKVDKTFVSIKDHDPMTINEATARRLYNAKRKKDAAKYIQTFSGNLQVLNGPYGPYVTDGKKNAKVPDGVEPAALTEAEAKALLQQAPAKRPRFRRSKRQ